MTAADYRALAGVPPAEQGKTPPQPAKARTAQLSPQKPASTGQRATSPELPGPKPGPPVRWQVATGLHGEQFPGQFRLVVTGSSAHLPALLAALADLPR